MRHFALALLAPLALSCLVLEGAVAASASAASDPTHPLVTQQAAQQLASANVGTMKPFTAPPSMAAVGGPGGPRSESFGFALASRLGDPPMGASTWDLWLLTTVGCCGPHAKSD